MVVSPDPSAVPGQDWQHGGVLVSPRCRELRRELRPLAWMVLEDVALDAVVEDGRLLARTSARRLAEKLGIDPGTAANALRQLRGRGLLALERDPGPAGRFGLAVYVIGNVDGLAVVAPSGAGSDMAEANIVRPCGVEPDLAAPDTAVSVAGTAVKVSSGKPRITPGSGVPAGGRQRCPASVEALGQVVLDLGLGTA